MSKLNDLKKHMRAGQVYRRADLRQYSNAVDRHLKKLVENGTLVKLSGGLYSYPKKTVFGPAPATDETLVRAFLKDSRFLLSSPNAYNTLGAGTTQLYNETIVYNYKRHGKFSLGGRVFDFRRKPFLPTKLNNEFLLVELVNNLEQLAEDREKVLEHAKVRACAMAGRRLSSAVRRYGKIGTKRFFADALNDESLNRDA